MAKAQQIIPMTTERKSIYYLQKMKDEGKLISMVGTSQCDPIWIAACEAAGIDMVRFVGPGENNQARVNSMGWQLRMARGMAPNINLNCVMFDQSYSSNAKAYAYAGDLMCDGADSVLTMAISNETLKYMADRWVAVFGHVGCLSGHQVGWFGGYSRVGRTCDEAMQVFRMAYEYQENGMVGMTIELTPREVTEAVAKKLRVPVISVAASSAGDGSEMVIYDLLGFIPTAMMPKHAKYYATFFDDAIAAFGEFNNDIKTKAYPEDKHGWGMDEKEYDKFVSFVEQKYPDIKTKNPDNKMKK